MKKFLILVFMLTAVNMRCMEENEEITDENIHEIIYMLTQDSVHDLTEEQKVLIHKIYYANENLHLNENQSHIFDTLPKFLKAMLEHFVIQSIDDLRDLDLGDADL